MVNGHEVRCGSVRPQSAADVDFVQSGALS